MPKIRAVIFDCYSTLVDIKTNENKDEVFDYLSKYMQYYGARIDAAELKSSLDLEKQHYLESSKEQYPEIDLEVVFSNILRKGGLDNPFMAESCCKLFRTLSWERFELFPDSLPVLEEMKKSGYPIGVVSDAQKAFCLEEGRMLGITDYFSCVVLSTQFGFRKPDPRLFSIACTLLYVRPDEAVYIGNDPETDVNGAKQVGIQTILIDRDSQMGTIEPKPDLYASNLWEAWNWIRSRM